MCADRPAATAQDAERDGGRPDAKALRRALGQFATGVAIVTTVEPDGSTPVGMTVNSFTSVSLDPPLVLWSLDKGARSYEAFVAAPYTAIHVLAHDQVALSNLFAMAGADKFQGLATEAGLGGVPLLRDVAARFECRSDVAHDGGDHVVLVSRIERFERFDRRVLAFAQGRYGSIVPLADPGAEHDGLAHAPYDDFLIPLTLRAYHHLFRAFAPSLIAEDATRGQLRILSILAGSGAMDAAELLTRTSLSRTSFEDALAALRSAGLLSDAGGAVALTTSGEDKLADLLRAAAVREEDSTAGLSLEERETLRTLLRKLVRAHEAP